MEVKPGYKLTDIGVFPVDWEVNSLLCVFQPKQGLQFPVEQQHTVQKVGFIKFIRIIDVTQSNEDPRYVVDPGHQHQIHEEDIFMVRYGSPGLLGIGYCGVIANNMFRLIPRQPMNRLFFYYLLQSKQAQIIQLSSSTTMAAVNFNSLRSLFVGYPCSLQEQDAIATILSNIDSLITSLEKLIEKKKNIKLGVMQELLTGKRRLPGFTGEWIINRLGAVAQVTKGQMITSDMVQLGNVPVIAGGKTPAYYHNQHNRTNETITISASGANAGYVAYHNYPIFASDCSTIGDNCELNIKLLYCLLTLKQTEIFNLQTGGAQPHVQPTEIREIVINYPLDIKEQEAIANCATDIDNAIQALEHQLYKYKSLKDGMMQALLTGRIKLV